MLRELATILLDALAPPRASERLVRSLDAATLLALETNDGLPYHDPRAMALVWEIKYYANARALTLAGELLYERVLDAAAEEVGRPLLLPVPMHPARRRERGHNSTELLCGAVLRTLRAHGAPAGVDYDAGALARVRNVPQQQGLARHKRLANMNGCMQAEARVRGRACVVVDDVTTTGATFAEARRALVAAGARSIHCIALAQS